MWNPIVARYYPYDLFVRYNSSSARPSHYIQKKELLFNPAAGAAFLVIAASIVLGVVLNPFWLLGIGASLLVALLVSVAMIGLECDDRIGSSLFVRQNHTFKFRHRYGEWKIDEVLSIKGVEDNELHRKQREEYMDYLRAGGERLDSVEKELLEWQICYDEQKSREMENAKHNLSRRTQIEEYRKMMEKQ